jgi:tripartite-type tricarboxylate transporter receptor subunit TctC
MKLIRREFLQLTAATAVVPALPDIAVALDYPTRPVRFVVGFPAGNAPDIIARLIGQWLSDRLGQQLVVENRPGASSNVATELALRATPDGYTILMVVLTNTLNATLYPDLKFNFNRDIAPVGGICDAPYVVIVAPEFPAKTIPEFIAYAKANPGKINFASGGTGTSTHVFVELFKMMTGVDLVHVPYRGPYMADLLSGQVQIVFNPIPQSLEFVRSGKLRALGVTTAKRLAALPDVPTVNESVPGYVATGWYGIVMPKDAPAEIVGKLDEALKSALADAKLQKQLADLGVAPMAMAPAEFGKFIDAETEKWAKVIKFAGIKVN